jgi:hypothetical protein
MEGSRSNCVCPLLAFVSVCEYAKSEEEEERAHVAVAADQAATKPFGRTGSGLGMLSNGYYCIERRKGVGDGRKDVIWS